jgi:hypothetical protein
MEPYRYVSCVQEYWMSEGARELEEALHLNTNTRLAKYLYTVQFSYNIKALPKFLRWLYYILIKFILFETYLLKEHCLFLIKLIDQTFLK